MPTRHNQADMTSAGQMPFIPSAGIETLVAGVTVITIAAATYGIWQGIKWLQEPWALSNEDMIRHRALVKAYKAMGLEIHDSWKLNEKNQPGFNIDYMQVKSEIDTRIEEWSKNFRPIYSMRVGILSLLSRHIESISKRSQVGDLVLGGYDRTDGVETMFLFEFISWFMGRVPVLPETEQDTIHAFKLRTEYCKEILTEFSRASWHNETRANFMNTLELLIQKMENYGKQLDLFSESKNFTDLMQDLSHKLTKFYSISLNMIYLLNRHANQSRLNVEQFLQPTIASPKVVKMLNSGKGRWLHKTLTLTGIRDDSFITKPGCRLTLDMIEKHLEGEHPDDKGCVLKQEYLNPTAKNWGHWMFATQPLPKPKVAAITSAVIVQESLLPTVKKDAPYPNGLSIDEIKKIAKKYLSDERDLIRQSMKIPFYNQWVSNSKFTGGVCGEVWVYGNPAGKASFDVMEAGTRRNVALNLATFKSFWQGYFGHYKQYAVYHRTNDARYPCFRLLNYLDSLAEQLEDMAKSIFDALDTVIKHYQNLPSNLETAQQMHKESLQWSLDLLTDQLKTDDPKYQVIADELKRLTLKSDVVQSSALLPIAQKEHVALQDWGSALEAITFKYNKSRLTHYARAKRIIDSDDFISEYQSHYVAKLDEQKVDFCLPEMKNIYANYIIGHYNEMNHYWWSSFWRLCKIQSNYTSFKSMYTKVNAIFNLLYQENPHDEPLQIEIFLVFDLLKKSIAADFKQYQYYPLMDIVDPLLTVEEQDELIIIQLDKKWLKLGRGIYTEQLNHLKQTVESQVTEISQLKIESENKERQLQDKDEQLKDKDRQIGEGNHILGVMQRNELLSIEYITKLERENQMLRDEKARAQHGFFRNEPSTARLDANSNEAKAAPQCL